MACGTSCSPSAVSVALRALRLNRSAPMEASSSPMRLDSDDTEIFSRFAAMAKFLQVAAQ
ncbi:hypothetical protein D3C81_2248560 [compost metagenome]